MANLSEWIPRGIFIFIIIALLATGYREYQHREKLLEMQNNLADIKNTLALEYTRQIKIKYSPLWPAITPQLFSDRKIPSNPIPAPSNEVTEIKMARPLKPQDGQDNGGWIYNRMTGEIRPDSRKYFKYK